MKQIYKNFFFIFSLPQTLKKIAKIEKIPANALRSEREVLNIKVPEGSFLKVKGKFVVSRVRWGMDRIIGTSKIQIIKQNKKVIPKDL